MTSLNWDIREYVHHLHPEYRWTVLTYLILHANLQLRAWPSNALIAHNTGVGSVSVSRALNWLEERGAVVIVPTSLRVEKEKVLHPRKKIYQLTGMINIDGQDIEYLYLNQKQWDSIANHVSEILLNTRSKCLTSKRLSGKCLPSEYEGSTVVKGTKEVKGTKDSAPNGTAPKSLRDAMWDAILLHRPTRCINPEGSPRMIGKVITQLCNAGITPADIQPLYQYIESKFSDGVKEYKIGALSSRAASYLEQRANARTLPPGQHIDAQGNIRVGIEEEFPAYNIPEQTPEDYP